ncbi:glycosyltransferase [Trichococcus flocculiformis]|uniref:glycosyltransferase n=1 Tax=Trichococcus flocculiformis TaxID=82803 RepID=UPI002AAB4681|nr:glycosyltransferase [Trichococcus flocculiformis]
MKILHVIDSLKSGGAEKLTTEIILKLKDYGASVDILLLTDEGNVFHRVLESNNISINVIPIKKMRSPHNIFYIYKLVKNEKYDIIHAHLFPATYWVSIVSLFIKFTNSKFVMTEHSTHNRRRNYRLFKIFDKFIYKKYDRVVSISRGVQRNLISWLNDSPANKRFCVIENGININHFKYAKEINKNEFEKFSNEIKYILCMIGRFTDSKDHDTVLRAMKRLPANIGLVLVGEGTLENKIREKIIEYDLLNRVILLGFRQDVERIIKTSDIIIHSANWEGFGLAAVEGMAAGKPVIASNVEGLSEIIEGYGLLFSHSNDIELSEIICKLTSNKEFYDEIATKCSNRAKRYDIGNTAESYFNIYKEILKG